MLAEDDVAAGVLAGCGVRDEPVGVGGGSGVGVTVLSGGRSGARAVHVALGVLLRSLGEPCGSPQDDRYFL